MRKDFYKSKKSNINNTEEKMQESIFSETYKKNKWVKFYSILVINKNQIKN